MTLNPVAASIYLPALGIIAADLDVPVAVVQLALTGYYVGIAVGVLVGGPLADALGRRAVLLSGLALLAAATAVVTLAPSAEILIGGRVLQGLGASTAVVVVRAVVSDVARGSEAVRAFSLLMGVLAAGPLLAPVLGAALQQLGGWRAIFTGLLVVSVIYLVIAAFAVPETLPRARRTPLRVRPLARNYGRLFADAGYVGNAAAVALAFGALSVHVSASSFVAQEVLGTDEWGFVGIYACYAVAVMSGSWLNAPLAVRFGPRRMLLIVQTIALMSTLVLVVFASVGPPSVAAYLPPMLIGCAAASAALANGTTLAMARATFAAGAGAALMGFLQFAVGAGASPLGGVAGPSTAVPMAVAMAGCYAASLVAALIALPAGRRAEAAAAGPAGEVGTGPAGEVGTLAAAGEAATPAVPPRVP